MRNMRPQEQLYQPDGGYAMLPALKYETLPGELKSESLRVCLCCHLLLTTLDLDSMSRAMKNPAMLREHRNRFREALGLLPLPRPRPRRRGSSEVREERRARRREVSHTTSSSETEIVVFHFPSSRS